MPPSIAIPPTVQAALDQGAALAYSVSGGKDSDALVLACEAELRGIPNPRLLIHADLGRTEWAQSLPQCQRLADRVGLELVVVRRGKGDMLQRWQQRWTDNVARYAELSTVSLILPWSTPGMRFCTSELKTSPICRALRQRFADRPILNALGIRAAESRSRASAPVAKPNPLLPPGSLTWLPIHGWQESDVWDIHTSQGFAPHMGYTQHQMSRISCVYCILASQADLTHATSAPETHETYRAMVDLEIASTFAFQDAGWLAEVNPALLTDAQRAALPGAKRRAAVRQAAEARIPAHLRYDGKGWPRVMPTPHEAALLADTRRTVAEAVGITIDYTDPDAILRRYAALLAARPPGQDGVVVQAELFGGDA